LSIKAEPSTGLCYQALVHISLRTIFIGRMYIK
jgi:hypothetical protein